MNRRSILQLTGASFVPKVGAGRTKRRQDDNGGNGEGKKRDQETPPCEPDIHFGNRDLIIDESRFSDDAWAMVGVENRGEKASGEIKATAEWLDDRGNILDDGSVYLPTLGAGETWRAYVSALPDAEAIDDFAATGGFSVSYPRSPVGITLAESELDTSDSTPTITGVIENTRDVDLEWLRAKGKFYDESGRVLAGNDDYQRDLTAGANWSFEIGMGFMPAQAPEITDHDVLLAGGPLQVHG